MSNKSDVKTLTIAESASYSGVLDLREYTLLAVLIPSSVTGTRLRVAASTTAGGTFKLVAATVAAFTVVADQWAVMSLSDGIGVCALPFIKLCFDDGSGNVQAQAAARTLTVVTKRG